MATFKPAAAADDCRKMWNGSAWVFTTDGGADTGYYDANNMKMGCGIRFPNVTIPNDATITSATIAFQARASDAGTDAKSRFHGEAADNASQFSTVGNYDGRARTTASVDWDSIAAWTQNTDYTSPELKTIVQEIIDRAGWVSGNALVIFWDDHEDRSSHTNFACRLAKDYDESATNPPILTVTYSVPSGFFAIL